jgi:hypothetical protein
MQDGGKWKRDREALGVPKAISSVPLQSSLLDLLRAEYLLQNAIITAVIYTVPH